ncbi:MAG: hypothetical protein ACYC6L_07520 [Anaerolineae bacterium]
MNLNQVADALTPEELDRVVHRLAARQAPDDRQSVTLTTLVRALSGSRELGQGREGWQAYLRLKQVIKDACAQVPGLRFIEGDS